MNRRSLRIAGALCAAATFLLDSAQASNPANTWRDCITVNVPGKYVVTPGTWTRNTVPIGQTWVGGGSITGPAGPVCNNIRFPAGVIPNDFHYFGDQFITPGGTVYLLWGDAIWGDFVAPLEMPLYTPLVGPAAQVSTLLDWSAGPIDPLLSLSVNGAPMYSGPLSSFIPSAFGLQQVGVRAMGIEPSYPSFCAGDGSASSCPCGNNSPFGSGEGCLNSLGLGGKLVATGSASVSSDTLLLSGSQMPNSFVLYFQGTSMLNGGMGVPFGDGLRCAGGALIRLGIELNSGGASQYPSGDPLISVKGAIPAAGGTRTYQGWYRDAFTYCTPATFNLTNGVLVNWVP